MRKYLSLALVLFFLGPQVVFAQDGGDVTVGDSVSDVEVTEAGLEGNYVIFVHVDCPHCKDVEKFVTDNSLDGEVKYRQLKDNQENLDELVLLWEEFNVPGQGPAWPIMFYLEGDETTYALGSDPIIEVLAEQFDVEVAESDPVPEDDSNRAVLLLGGVVIAGVFLFGLYNMVSGNKEE